jgi:site-specific recombinase XerD
MSRSEPRFEPRLAQLREHFRKERYSYGVVQNYPVAVRRFLRDFERRGQAVEAVTPVDVEAYLDALRLRRRRGPLPAQSRRMHGAAIRMLLRLIHGEWPPQAMPTTAHAIAEREVVIAYDAWMTELRGLSPSTRRSARAATYRLLQWLRDQGKTVAALSVADLDAYVAWRSTSMRRTSIALLASTLRGVLRYLHGSGRMPLDLAGEVTGPPLYALESIPSIVRPQDLERALKVASRDHSTLGRRDYAILMLLSTYGLRGGEILGLRLSDIDWRHERLSIRHSKTGAHSELPLLRGPADALLDYLKYGRPTTTAREVFLRACAPYRAICSSAALSAVIARRLKAVGVVLTGKRGAHVLRHSRAVSLLRGGVSLKVIGDVLGHRSERSTAVYLKLATEDLRSVALDVPAGVSP